MARTFFVSDLHLFSRRSRAERHREEIFAAVKEADTFVLGGDIFDFRWSELPSLNDTISAAIDWLTALMEENEAARFHFVLGNHDYNRRFMERLDELAAERENLNWHRFHLRLGPSLFLHGDAADRAAMNTASLALHRHKWTHEERPPRAWQNWLYDRAIDVRLHRLASLVHTPRRTAERLLHYARESGHGPESGLEHVYFGHTHLALSDFEHQGVLFHNGGAPVRGLDFRIVEAKFEKRAE